MTDRRYRDEEIAAIFRAAAEEPPAAASYDTPPGVGLTLAELQAIGREVGIEPTAVARAALVLDASRDAAPRRFLGLPIGVGRTVHLERALTDAEWERLVVELREVFRARGTTRSQGSLREWTNGNLHVFHEPTEQGHRLRLGTTHGGARASLRGGLATLVGAAALTVVSALGGDLAGDASTIGILVAGGVALIANGAVRLPGWARLRQRQMDALAARVAGLANAPRDGPGGAS